VRVINNLVHKHLELIMFAVAGVIGYGADVTVTMLFHSLLGVYFARFPAFMAAATITWLFNRSITFKNRHSRHTSIIKEYIHYVSLMTFGLVVNYAAYAVSITVLANQRFAIPICVAIGSLAGLLVNFFMSKRYVYTKESADK